jgi:hypothetical protein
MAFRDFNDMVVRPAREERMLRIGIISLWITALLLPSIAWARLLSRWPYKRLFKEADLVVIATATEIADCQDRSTDNPWKQESFGVNTSFRVESTLKGKLDGDKIKVLHFRLKKRPSY